MTTSDPIIVSIPHCGTRFLKERLGIKEHLHVGSKWDTLRDSIVGRHVIVPLREPSTVWRSWCRRHDHKRFPYADFFLAWGCLQALDNQMDLDVICIDKCEDARIADWSPVGDEDGSRAGWHLIKTDLRGLHKLPIVERHYGPY